MANFADELFVVFLLFFVGKGAYGAGHRPDEVRVLTYNTGLYDLSPEPGLVENNREQRLAAIIEELGKSKAELVCLQEVWFGQDLEQIVNDLDSVFPYSFSSLHTNPDNSLPPQANVPGNAPCPRNVLFDLANCSRDNGCTNPDLRQELECAAIPCAAQIGALLLTTSQECVSCVAQSSEDAEKGIARCSSETSPTSNPRRMNNDGLLLLSKQRLNNPQHFEFYPIPGVNALNKKGYIYAKYGNEPDVLHAVCTHLTPLIEGVVEPILSTIPDFNTTQKQIDYEVTTLIKNYAGMRPLVLMGDINIGQAFTNKLIPVLPITYQRLKRSFDTTVPARYCTFCDETRNPYNVNDRAKSIDHIMGNGIRIVYSKVVLTFEMASVTSLSGAQFPLSDHYGFECILHFTCGCVDQLLQN